MHTLVYITNAATTKHTNIELVHCDGMMYTHTLKSTNDEQAMYCIQLGGM